MFDGTVFFVSLLIASGALAYVIFRIAGLDFKRPSPAVIFILYYLANAYVGVAVLFFDLSDRAIVYGVVDKEIVWIMLGLSATALILIAFGFLITPGPANVAVRQTTPLSSTAMWVAATLFVICCGVLVLYIRSLPQVPIFAALAGNPIDAVEFRQTLGTSNYVVFGKPQYFNAFVRILMPFLSYLFLAQALARPTATSITAAAGAILATAFASMVDTHKAGLVALLFAYWITYLIARRRTMRLRQLVVAATVMFVVGGALSSLFMGTAADDPWALLEDVNERLLVGNLVPAYHVMEMFWNQDLLWGRSFPNPLGMLPYEHYPLDVVVWTALTPSATAQALYSAPAVLWAEMYANFGLVGLLLSTPFLGSVARISQGIFERVGATPLRTALLVFWSMYFMGFVTRGMIQVVSLAFDYYVAVVLLSTVLIFEVDRRIRARAQRSVQAPSTPTSGTPAFDRSAWAEARRPSRTRPA